MKFGTVLFGNKLLALLQLVIYLLLAALAAEIALLLAFVGAAAVALAVL
jgi:hypothetical protein